jgi:ATP-dependent phosphoenolpyruvate carboxykinase
VPINYTLLNIFIYTAFQLTPLNPYLYRYYVNSVISTTASILQQNIISNNSDVEIVNTGYSSGGYGSSLVNVEIQEGLTAGYIHTKNTFTVDNVQLVNVSYYKLEV